MAVFQKSHTSGNSCELSETTMTGLQTPRTAGLQTPRTAGLQTPRTPGLQTPRTAGLQTPRTAGLQTPRTAGLQTPRTAGLQTPKTTGFKIKKVGQFLVGPRLAEDSCGEVRLAVHIGTREKVAIKVALKRKLVQMPAAQRHFRREVLLLQRVRHPNIARFYGTIESSTCYYLVHELVLGGHLLVRVAVRGRLSEDDGRLYMRQMVSAVDHLHRCDIVHRNLKLESFLLDERDNIKLVGFGVSAVCRDHDLLLSTQCVSPLYAAPELFTGQKYGKPVDIWSLGVCLFAMLVGRLPFFPGEESSLTELRDLVLRGCRPPDYLSSECSSLLVQMLEPVDTLRITASVVVAHTWLASTTDPRRPQRSGLDPSPARTSLAGSRCSDSSGTEHQRPALDNLDGSHGIMEDIKMLISKENVSDKPEPPTTNSSGEMVTVCEAPRDRSAGSEKERIASRQFSQLSGSVSSTCSWRTVSSDISQASSSYKSNILQLKQLRQNLARDRSSPIIRQKSDCSFVGRHPRTLYMSGKVKGQLQLSRNACSESHPPRQGVQRNTKPNFPEEQAQDTSRGVPDCNNLLVKGVSFSLQDSVSLHLTPVFKDSASSHKIPTENTFKQQMFAPSSQNSPLPSGSSKSSFPHGAAHLHRDTHDSGENELDTNKIRQVPKNGQVNSPTYLQGDTIPLVKMLPRQVMSMLRDPFSRDSWGKNKLDIQSWRRKQQIPSDEGGRKPERVRPTWALPGGVGHWPSRRLAQIIQERSSETLNCVGQFMTDGNCDGPSSDRGEGTLSTAGTHKVTGPSPGPSPSLSTAGTHKVTGPSPWRAPGRELTSSPRQDLEDFLMPVTRVVIIHS